MSDTPNTSLADAALKKARGEMRRSRLALNEALRCVIDEVPEREIGEMISATIAYVSARKARSAMVKKP